jgi:hypothetical protein
MTATAVVAPLRPHRRILIYLATVSTCRGRLPRAALLDRYGLSPYFLPLYEPLIKGNMRICRQLLDDSGLREQHQAWGTWLLLIEKLEVLCWRNLMRRVCVGNSLLPFHPH